MAGKTGSRSLVKSVANTARNVALFDQSCFVKYVVAGRGACAVLNRICANNVDVLLASLSTRNA
ncbi:hypothetical protein [Bradyrhizobium manausense]|uniref:hypothetical protein n=1 Tax=Bradyrhizobium manausense TaxID=989370 RepID=UPI0012ED7FEF|nr:hypothetical protein [Bradyrhizobium manausense]